ncbi:MAG: PAS domain S-box protein, partial [Syntrophomonas sp.]
MTDCDKTKEQLINELAEMRQKTENALRLSEERFFKAFHCSPDPTTITSLSQGIYVEVNEAFLEVTGYKRDQVIGYSSQKLGIWEDPAERNLMLQKIHNNESI